MNSTWSTACIYILHLVDRDGHSARLGGKYSAGHYCGKADDLPVRLREHRTRVDSKAAVIMREVILRGLSFKLARVIIVPKSEAAQRERQIKKQNIGSHYCPLCRIEREQQKLAALQSLPPTTAIKQRISKARRALERAKVLLREADDIAYIAGLTEKAA